MSVTKSFISNIKNISQSNAYLKRTRLFKILENAGNYPAIAVYAGSGYGKTRTVHSFLQQYSAFTTWIQLSERDNTPARFWEKYTHLMSMTWPKFGNRLAKIGFPETDEAYAKYNTLRNEVLPQADKYFLVFDDFHLLHNPVVLRYFERDANSLPNNGTMILISRTIPEVNLIDMMMQERVFIIREDTLCFTEDEIAEYFNQLDLSVSRQDIRDIYDDTHGWAFAINLIGRSLSKDAKYERHALAAMKKNIFSLIESETSQIKNEPLWYFLLRISLIGHLAATLIKALADNDGLIAELDRLNAYIRYDHHLGVYRIHDIFLDYLRQHQDMLPLDVKQDTYNKAGMWCEDNHYSTDALAYYVKAENYDSIMRIIYMFNLQIPQEMAKYAMEVLEQIPEDIASHNPFYPAMCIKMKISLGLLEEASTAAEEFAKEYEAQPESPDKNQALAGVYGAWSTLRLIMSSYTHKYDFDLYFERMREYYDKAPYKVFGPGVNQSVGAYALLVGTKQAGACEEYIEALGRAIPHSSHALKGCMYGLDDLARGELFYYQRDMDNAEQYLSLALNKAQIKDQYDIQCRSIQYLMLIDFSRGDMKAANHWLLQAEAMQEIKAYATRYEACDIIRSYYYLVIDQPEHVPDWLKSDFERSGQSAFLDNNANLIKAKYRFAARQYSVLLAFLENVREDYRLLLSRIELRVLEALTLYQLKRREEAFGALAEAYELAEPNRIIIPFTQYAKHMRTLSSAALRDSQCTIPKPWLEDVNRKASAYARRQSHMISEYKAAGNEGKITLTNRETKVLQDLCQGLSRTEIAASQGISVSTVKMVINTIYNKLSVTSLRDAIRIALVRNII